MAELNYSRIRSRLLLSGVAPKYVRRTIQELRSHWDDLVSHSTDSGLTDSQAEQHAATSMGSEDLIVANILAKPELKSWSYRFPKTMFIGGGLLLHLLLMLILFAIAIAPLMLFVDLDPPPVAPLWVKTLFFIVFNSVLYLLTPAITIAIYLWARHRAVPLLWPAIAISVIAFIGSAWWIVWTFESRGEPSVSLQLGWGYMFVWFPAAARPELGTTLFHLGKAVITVVLTAAVAYMLPPHSAKRGNSTLIHEPNLGS